MTAFPIDVVVYGEIGLDNIIRVPFFPRPQKDAPVTGDSYEIGGAGTNVAVFLASWGLNVRISGNMLGDDPYGIEMRTRLEKYSTLDLSYLITRAGVESPFCRIIVRPDGERIILYYNSETVPMFGPTAEMIGKAKILALDLNGGEERVEAAIYGHTNKIITVVGDVMWSEHSILPFCDVVTNSVAMLEHEFPGEDPVKIALDLQRISKGVLITSNGNRAVHVVDRHGQQFWVQPPEVNAVDTTGAGDALKSGVIYGLIKGWELADCVRWGVAAGTLNVMRIGAASNPPSVDEIEQILSSVKII